MKKEVVLYEGKRLLLCGLGAFLYAAGTNLFVVPAGLYTGGLMGFCQVIRTLLARYFHMNFSNFDIAGIIYYLINIPIFVIAFRRMGRMFFVKTLLTVTVMTLFLSLIPTRMIVKDSMAACMVGGIITGAGIGLTLRMASSGGGMDVVGVLLIRWKRDFSVGKANLFVNLALYAVCLFLFDVEIVVYSVIYAAVHSVAMDKVHTQNINVEAKIITKADTAALEKVIFEEIYRGITKWSTMGAYTHEDSHILYITLSKYEVSRLKAAVHRYDPNAFIVINEGVSVDGNFIKKL
ncbi:YitT family protein [Acetatifactor muris]|jgi:uncharacterized membrane-anchored protein YitT (DUF2179 family)|uniref:DUF2179 domain-containing protein n=1 Tax=Acetatifactor muris TaxID=879566 RepID=A0A2K4ZF60_9FIRM|nr:YitT family protein [Acetatifactor muris]MCI8799226.1 YitT family protein [Lachnospiraceae bacterium]MCR2047300.1 YitT family protein [Acetatifactor muris]SOY29107.1 hypothetical protein AMURIS_01822 [Acetatifactor muris]